MSKQNSTHTKRTYYMTVHAYVVRHPMNTNGERRKCNNSSNTNTSALAANGAQRSEKNGFQDISHYTDSDLQELQGISHCTDSELQAPRGSSHCADSDPKGL